MGIRTPDLLNAIEALYQLSYDPFESGDPNGIRTRVLAVKGRCPRPLDDEVIF